MKNAPVAATQMACDWDLPANLDRAEALVREAAGQGAQVVLLQELFEAPYFCKDEDEKHFALAREAEGNAVLQRFQALAAELEVVLPFSFYERAGNTGFNSLIMIDADGKAEFRPVTVGPWQDENWFIESGLEAGDTVVVLGALKLRAGVPVKITEPAAQSPADSTTNAN